MFNSNITIMAEGGFDPKRSKRDFENRVYDDDDYLKYMTLRILY